MKSSSTPENSTAPLTFAMNEDLVPLMESLQEQSNSSRSAIIREAIDTFDFKYYSPLVENHTQNSVRLSCLEKQRYLEYSKIKNVSIGEVIRTAVLALTPTEMPSFSLRSPDPFK